MAETIRMNRFLLVNVAAQRARQLMQGAEPVIRTKSRKPAAVAVKELDKGLVPYYMPGDEPESEAEVQAESASK